MMPVQTEAARQSVDGSSQLPWRRWASSLQLVLLSTACRSRPAGRPRVRRMPAPSGHFAVGRGGRKRILFLSLFVEFRPPASIVLLRLLCLPACLRLLRLPARPPARPPAAAAPACLSACSASPACPPAVLPLLCARLLLLRHCCCWSFAW